MLKLLARGMTLIYRRSGRGITNSGRLLGDLQLPLLVLLLVTLVFRLLWVLSPYELAPDGVQYDRMAHLFLQSGTIAFNTADVPSAFYMPGYPLFLAGVYFLFGAEPSPFLAVRMAQALLSVLTLFVLYRIGVRLHGRTLGFMAILLGGLYPSFTLANQRILTEVLFTFLLCLLVLAALRLLDAPSKRNGALFGVLLALCCFVRPTVVLWGVVPFLFLLRRVPLRRLALLSIVGLLSFCVLMSPWWIRNATVFHRFVPFATSSANPLLVGTYTMFGERVPDSVFAPWNWTAEERAAETAPEDELVLNAEWRWLALERLGHQLETEPFKVVKLRLKATAEALRGPDLVWDLPTWLRPTANVLHQVLLLLAVLGFFLRVRDPRSSAIGLLVVYYVLAHIAILMMVRYIFPLMPLLLVGSGYGIVAVREEIRRVRALKSPVSRPAT